MNHDYIAKVGLTESEYVSLLHLAADSGLSQSAYMRQLLRVAISNHAASSVSLSPQRLTRTGLGPNLATEE